MRIKAETRDSMEANYIDVLTVTSIPGIDEARINPLNLLKTSTPDKGNILRAAFNCIVNQVERTPKFSDRFDILTRNKAGSAGKHVFHVLRGIVYLADRRVIGLYCKSHRDDDTRVDTYDTSTLRYAEMPMNISAGGIIISPYTKPLTKDLKETPYNAAFLVNTSWRFDDNMKDMIRFWNNNVRAEYMIIGAISVPDCRE